MLVLGLSPIELSSSLRLPASKATFAIAIAIRLFWIQLFLVASVGLFG